MQRSYFSLRTLASEVTRNPYVRWLITCAVTPQKRGQTSRYRTANASRFRTAQNRPDRPRRCYARGR
eukprot:297650-Rhodomonas_salina.1